MGHESFLAVVVGFFIFATVTLSNAQPAGLDIDLGYGVYRGFNNASTGLNIWKGIRYAAPPTGSRRWQAPEIPELSDEILDADEFGPSCPQAMPSFPGRARTFIPGDEDCLFLNVYSPEQATEKEPMPVFVSIHGGGYGLGSANTDMSAFMDSNDNSFLAVTIQYRLGAFGFLSSAEVKSRGVLNAGLLDQKFAFEWIQKHISKFGGDPDRVTIAGESAGGGSVLLHAVAEDGAIGTKLFKNIIAASPWVPTQPYHDDKLPRQHYYDLAEGAGCPISGDGVFDCLIEVESLTLQYAANQVSSTSPTFYGNWAFIPVTDGSYVTSPPSVLLDDLKGKVNGERVLVGNNANEGPLLIPSTIQTQDQLITWLKGNFVNLSDKNVTNILEAYPSDSGPVDPDGLRYETDGFGPGTAVNISQVGTGQQQRAYNMGAEGAVNCPSYWLASAFTGHGKTAWHYQYSVPFAIHGADVAAYYGPSTENQGNDLVTAFRRIYGNFITRNDPSVSNEIANGKLSANPDVPHPASNWPAWTDDTPVQLNLNQTGGTPYTTFATTGSRITQFRDPGLRNDFAIVDAYTWEGGRGKRCDFWRELSPYVPQ